MAQGGLGGLIPSGGGADGFYDLLRAAGALTRRPRIRIPGAPDGAMPDVPRLPEPEVPRAPEPDAPRVDDPDAPRDGRFDGEWEDVNTPWYKNPLNVVPASMAVGIGMLAKMMSEPGSGVSDTTGTADLHADQAPLPVLPGPKRYMTIKERAAAGNQDAIAYLQRQQDAKDRRRQLFMWAGGSNNFGGHNADQLNMLYGLPKEEQQRVIAGMMPMDRNRAMVEAQNAERAGEMARTAVSRFMERNGGPLAGVQAQAAAEQLREEREKNRRDDEEILANKYAREGWFGYDEFTVAEQQLMFDDLIDQGYTPAEAQRAVDRQAHTRRASQHADWNAGPR